jgi:hypothetical protein
MSGHEPRHRTQGLMQFQLHGDAAERYERWAVPFVTGPWCLPCSISQNYDQESA